MTDQEKMARLESLLADYVVRYGALPDTKHYFSEGSRNVGVRVLEQREYDPIQTQRELFIPSFPSAKRNTI